MQALVASVQDVVFDIETALEMQLGVKPLPFSGMDSKFWLAHHTIIMSLYLEGLLMLLLVNKLFLY